METIKLGQSWPNRVKGSWWKAISIIVSYFILRMIAEGTAIGLGYKASGKDVTPDMMSDVDQIVKLMTKVEWFYHLQIAVLCLLLIAMVYAFKLKLFNLDKLSIKGFVYTFGMFVMFLLMQMAFGMFLAKFVPGFKEPENQQLVAGMFGDLNPLFLYLSIAIFTPITEEIIFRGLIMKGIFPLMPFVGALVASVLFALVHGPSDIYQFFVYYILSVGITWTYWKTRRIEYAIFFHILQNSIAYIGLMLVK